MKLHCLYFSPCSHLFPVFSSANCSCITKFMSNHRRTYPHIPVPGSCSKTLSVCLPVTVHNSDSSAGVYRSFCHVLSLPVSDVFISLSPSLFLTFSISVSLFLFLLHVAESHLDVLCPLLTTLPTFPWLSFALHPAFPTLYSF